jgi:DNA polymerase-1
MALRGDSIDNIPGAPGIGDKGSVELIQQFGSVEAALDHASEVKRKTYRESLENNRDTVLLSKELVTIHCEVPVELELENMRTQAPDVSACRALFNELEFTTMLKELAPEEEATPLSIIPDPSPEEISRFVSAARTHGFSLAFDTSLLEVASEQVAEAESEAIEEEEPELKTMSLGLFDAPQPAAEEKTVPQTLKVAVSAEAGRALVFSLDKALDNPAAEPLRAVLADEHTGKSLHDLKAALRILGRHGADHGLRLAGPVDDLMLYSYLINPTHTTHPLPDVVARFSGRALPPPGDELLPASANAIRSLGPLLKEDVESLGAGQVYRPAVSSGPAAHGRGRRAHRPCGSLRHGRPADGRDGARERADLRRLRPSLQYQFAQAAGRRAVQQNALAQAHEVWARQGSLHGRGCARRAGAA